MKGTGFFVPQNFSDFLKGFSDVIRIPDRPAEAGGMEEPDMKKAITGILTAGVLALAGTMGVSAAVPGQGARFSDTDGNGVCDYYEAGCLCRDTNGDGICDDHGTDCPGISEQSGCGHHGSRMRLQDGTGRGCASRGGCRR